MNTRNRIILITALTGLALLAADSTQLRAEQRVARTAAAAQESQKFESLLSARIARLAESNEDPTATRLVQRLSAWISQLRLPSPLLAPLSDLQRARFEGAPLGVADSHLRRGRRLNQQRHPAEPE